MAQGEAQGLRKNKSDVNDLTKHCQVAPQPVRRNSKYCYLTNQPFDDLCMSLGNVSDLFAHNPILDATIDTTSLEGGKSLAPQDPHLAEKKAHVCSAATDERAHVETPDYSSPLFGRSLRSEEAEENSRLFLCAATDQRPEPQHSHERTTQAQ
ncbi:unnamed protein product [Caenorhabditis auriculariae]|uniref:Uncharacterized protein n=1 Tax=Caenorhabditis auriculariae TaxID=2777116 RepID=A0A8S1H2T0_9PELO|nr:unnamed protein product [Caenorhabditis auriculariae]